MYCIRILYVYCTHFHHLSQVKRLKTENDSLKTTIQQLQSGHHDIRLQGQSQIDMETVMNVWNTQPDLDIQMKENDQSGTLKAFWQEQLKRMSNPQKRQQWNPVVLRFMLHLWESMGEKNFRLLDKEKVLVLPSKRHLVRLQTKIARLDAIDPSIYMMLRDIVDKKVKTPEDREMLLIWDAMGYNAGIRYDKHSGQLIGFAEDFHFGLCVQRFANKVNVLSVVSPQEGFEIHFPIAHHHVNTLTSVQIYEQVLAVVENLYNLAAVTVVGMICDGASEHTKFFRIVLDGAASRSPDLNVYMGHPCDESVKVFSISDVPHLIKKGRGSLYRSGVNVYLCVLLLCNIQRILIKFR